MLPFSAGSDIIRDTIASKNFKWIFLASLPNPIPEKKIVDLHNREAICSYCFYWAPSGLEEVHGSGGCLDIDITQYLTWPVMISVRPASRHTLSSRTLRTFYRDLTLETMAATRVLQPDTGNSINLRHGEMAIYTSHLGTLHWVLYIGSYSSILILTSLSHQYLNISSSWDIVVNFGHLILTYDFVVKSICHVWDLFCYMLLYNEHLILA